MDNYVTGATVKRLREKGKMTQSEVTALFMLIATDTC